MFRLLWLASCVLLVRSELTFQKKKKLEQAARPHVLFMMADQLRFDAMGAVWHGYKTPNLDALAKAGVRWSRGYSATPTCTPARAALLTGQKPWNHGMLGYGAVAKRYPFEMPRAMKDAGYHTASIGKDHFGWDKWEDEGVPHGFESTLLYDGISDEPDNYHQFFQKTHGGEEPESCWPTLDMNSWRGAPYVCPEQFHPTAWVGSNAVQFIRNYSLPQPFFLKVSFHRPHSPYDPPARLFNSTLESQLPPVRLATDGWDIRFRGAKGDPQGCGDTPDAWCGQMPDSDSVTAKRAYMANVQFVDEQVGLIMDTLKAKKMLNNTLIIWTADHGDGQGDHFHWRKGYPYEFSSHVPFIVKWPTSFDSKVAPGTILPQVVELRDIFPTVLDAADASHLIPANYSMDGKSLLCLLHDPTGCEWRDFVDMEHDICYNNTNHWNGLTDGVMKYVYKAWNASEQLFNLTADPYENEDVAQRPDYHDDLVKWRLRMVDQFEKEGRGPAWVKDGKLIQRVKGQLYSPNFPKSSPQIYPNWFDQQSTSAARYRRSISSRHP